MDAPMALFGRIAAGNGIGQSCGAPLAVIPGAFGLEPARNPPGEPLLAVVEEQIGQVVFLQAVDQLCSGFSAAFGVLRMSSGPSARKLKPRSGTSS